MGLMQQARQDAATILTDLEGWAVPVVFTAPTGEVAELNALFIDRNEYVDQGEGNPPANLQLIHCTYTESAIPVGYPLRNADGKVHMENHILTAANSTGILRNYKFEQWHADQTVGIVRCVMSYHSLFVPL